ncbi:MAG TPA: helix-turn-helix transcriptional regulator [Longimicrobiaceae bacterium]|nr:helix-turn-helix transcriptional regulator [Longimicrobiaceae bacterium]
MDTKEREALEAAGYTVVTDVHEWLGLSRAESEFINLKLELRHLVRAARERAGLSQAQAARKLKSSQSRVSKMESGDPSVSLDLLVSAALALGATREELARTIAGAGDPPASDEQTAEAKPARRSRTRAA